MRSGRERLIIAVLAGCGMLTSLQFTLIVPVLPEIPGLLDVSANDASWMVTVTLLTGTAATPVLTRLADLRGRRRMLLVCLALLVVGSVIAALGLTFPTVLVGRALQGSSTAILRRTPIAMRTPYRSDPACQRLCPTGPFGYLGSFGYEDTATAGTTVPYRRSTRPPDRPARPASPERPGDCRLPGTSPRRCW